MKSVTHVELIASQLVSQCPKISGTPNRIYELLTRFQDTNVLEISSPISNFFYETNSPVDHLDEYYIF